jgi:hypothetical protein
VEWPLKNIAYLLYDVKPLVLWSGHGYHIIIPVNAKQALENFVDFIKYTTEPSKEFLQFAERFLSLKNADVVRDRECHIHLTPGVSTRELMQK